MNKTERIVGFKLVNTERGEQFVVTTHTGAVVFVPKAQFDASANTITYKAMKAGDEYTNKDGEVLKRVKDGNNFVCQGKLSSIDLADYLISRGEKVILNA